MSKEPLIIKCTFYNIRPEELEEVRKIIKKQMEEATPVVMLPSGFELAEVDVHLLEEIKAKIENIPNDETTKPIGTYDYCLGAENERGVVLEILDNYIAQLKGENK